MFCREYPNTSSAIAVVRSGETPWVGEPLTDDERAVLDFVYSEIRDNGYQPSLSEIADAFGYSQASSAMHHVARLYLKGYLAPQPDRGRSRNFVLLRRPDGRPFNGFVERD